MGDPAVTATVLLIDDHPAILLGLQCIFAAEPDFEVVGAVQDAREAPRSFSLTAPDLTVLDLSMPGHDGAAVLDELRALRHDCRVLVLTSCADPATVHRVVHAGADGYQLKDSPSSALVDAARSVLRGENPVDPRVTRALLGAVAQDDSHVTLTARECDVLRLVAIGMADKQIATRLGIGVSTVKTHLSSIFQSLGVADRTSAAMWARTWTRQSGREVRPVVHHLVDSGSRLSRSIWPSPLCAIRGYFLISVTTRTWDQFGTKPRRDR